MNTRMTMHCVGHNCGVMWIYPHYRNCPQCGTPADPKQITVGKLNGFVDTPDPVFAEDLAKPKSMAEPTLATLHAFPGSKAATHIDARFDPQYPTDTVLAKAANAALHGCMILGFKPDGSIYIDSNVTDGSLVTFALFRAQYLMMKGMDKE